MTVRGGGFPTSPLAFVPIGRMGPPLRSFAADAHDCIMVRVLGPTGYKVVARLIAPASGLPSDRHPDRSKRAIVLEAVKVWPDERRRMKPGRDEETDFQIEKKMTMKKDAPPCLNFLTKKAPYKGLGADSEEKHEPVSDIDIAVVDSLKLLDLKRPIREADIRKCGGNVC